MSGARLTEAQAEVIRGLREGARVARPHGRAVMMDGAFTLAVNERTLAALEARGLVVAITPRTHPERFPPTERRHTRWELTEAGRAVALPEETNRG